MDEEIVTSAEGSAVESEEKVGEATEEARVGTEVPVGETAALSSESPAAPARFKHSNEGSAVLDTAQVRYFVWAGDPDELDGVVDELNRDPEAEGRFAWLPGTPAPAGGPPAESVPE